MKTKIKVQPKSYPKPEKVLIETFRDIGEWELSNMRQEEPSCFNSNVRIEKFRVIVEPIPEPKEVYVERLRKLWEECDNHHHWHPLKGTANRLGIELDDNLFGKKRKKTVY